MFARSDKVLPFEISEEDVDAMCHSIVVASVGGAGEHIDRGQLRHPRLGRIST